MKTKTYFNVLGFLAILLISSLSYAQNITIEGTEALKIRQKMSCLTLEQGKPMYSMWEGRIYSRVQGEKDRHLFNVIGFNIRQCECLEDPVKGKGFNLVGREIMLYLDPKTNNIVDTWENPWTGVMVNVVHVANDPVNMRRPFF